MQLLEMPSVAESGIHSVDLQIHEGNGSHCDYYKRKDETMDKTK